MRGVAGSYMSSLGSELALGIRIGAQNGWAGRYVGARCADKTVAADWAVTAAKEAGMVTS